MLLIYRLVVVQMETRKPPKQKKTSYMYATDYSSKTSLFNTGNGMNKKRKATEQSTPLHSPAEEIPVNFEIKRAYKNKSDPGYEIDWSLV